MVVVCVLMVIFMLLMVFGASVVDSVIEPGDKDGQNTAAVIKMGVGVIAVLILIALGMFFFLFLNETK